MPTPLEEHIDVTIDTNISGITRVGFGIPLITGYFADSVFSQRAKTYTNIKEMEEDGFAVEGTNGGIADPVVTAARRVFSSSPTVERIVVGRMLTQPTMVVEFTPKIPAGGVVAGQEYTVQLNGVDFTHVATGVDTPVTITAGISAQLDLANDPIDNAHITKTEIGDSNEILEITAGASSTSGLFEYFVDPELFDVHNSSAVAANLLTELGQVQAVNDDWYTLIQTTTDLQTAKTIATAGILATFGRKMVFYANGDSVKFHVASQPAVNVMRDQPQGTPFPDVLLTGDIANEVAAAAGTDEAKRWVLIDHSDPDKFPNAAWVGKCLARDPGSKTWKFKSLPGIATSAYSSSQRTNLRKRNTNFYTSVAGVGITQEGTTLSNNFFIDLQRFTDWLIARVQENVFVYLQTALKVPYTEEGLLGIKSVILGVLDEGIRVGGLAANPEPRVVVPNIATVLQADKESRKVKNVTFEATLAGAVHNVVIRGNLLI